MFYLFLAGSIQSRTDSIGRLTGIVIILTKMGDGLELSPGIGGTPKKGML
jgi:hypothetical protein